MLAAGLLAVLVIIFTQVSYFQSIVCTENTACSSVAEPEEEGPMQDTTQVSVSAVTVPSTLIINYNQTLPLLFEVVQSEEAPKMVEQSFDISSAKWVKYLFRVIIAPNAP